MTLLEQCLGFVMVFSIIIMVLWQRNAFLYCLGAPVAMVFGLALAIEYDPMEPFWVIGISIAIIGTYFLFKVAVNEFIPMLRRKK